MKRSSIKAKRETPRRNDGRVKHARLKPKATSKTVEEDRHLQRVAEVGCLVCGLPANVHHIMHAPGKRCRRDHRFVVPLCHDHHQGQHGVHGLGSESMFLAAWNVDLVSWAIAAWESRNEPEHPVWRHKVTTSNALPYARAFAIKSGLASAKWTQTR